MDTREKVDKIRSCSLFSRTRISIIDMKLKYLDKLRQKHKPCNDDIEFLYWNLIDDIREWRNYIEDIGFSIRTLEDAVFVYNTIINSSELIIRRIYEIVLMINKSMVITK